MVGIGWPILCKGFSPVRAILARMASRRTPSPPTAAPSAKTRAPRRSAPPADAPQKPRAQRRATQGEEDKQPPKDKGGEFADNMDDVFAQLSIDASGPSELGNDDPDIWVRSSGWTPIEFLARTYRNGFQPMQHRIAAAKAILDYTHRKLPTRIDLKTEETSTQVQLDAAALSKLSDKELDALTKILEKLK